MKARNFIAALLVVGPMASYGAVPVADTKQDEQTLLQLQMLQQKQGAQPDASSVKEASLTAAVSQLMRAGGKGPKGRQRALLLAQQYLEAVPDAGPDVRMALAKLQTVQHLEVQGKRDEAGRVLFKVISLTNSERDDTKTAELMGLRDRVDQLRMQCGAGR
jgi:hypothetical protein